MRRCRELGFRIHAIASIPTHLPAALLYFFFIITIAYPIHITTATFLDVMCMQPYRLVQASLHSFANFPIERHLRNLAGNNNKNRFYEMLKKIKFLIFFKWKLFSVLTQTQKNAKDTFSRSIRHKQESKWLASNSIWQKQDRIWQNEK